MYPISYFDGHCDTISRCLETGEGLYRNSGHVDLTRGGAFTAYAQIFALFYDSAKTRGKCFAMAEQQYKLLMAELQVNADHAVFCRTAAEVQRAARQGKIAALLGIEGAELLDCDIERIPTAERWGARYVTLTWNRANAISGTNREQSDRGLTDYGRTFVRELYQSGILPDVSHLSDAGFWDLISMGLGPVIASHSNSRALCAHSRNLTDDMFRAIVETGGVVGLNLYSDFVGTDTYDFPQLLRHVDHLLELGGDKTLCLGADMDGCEALCGDMEGLESIPALYEAFLQHGYDRALLDRLFYHNWLTLFDGVR